MADNLSHLKVDPFFDGKTYVYPNDVIIEFTVAQRNRIIHGKRVKDSLKKVKDQFRILKDTELPDNIITEDAVYVEFISEWGYDFKFDSINQERSNPSFQIVNIQKEDSEVDGKRKTRYRTVVMMREGAVSDFIKKVNYYMTTDTRFGKPTGQALFANLAEIQLATLKSFWSDGPELAFPGENDNVWWEVWFRKSSEAKLGAVMQNLEAVNAQIGLQTLQFPEHTVKLVKATANQLSQSLLLLDNLSELRKPQQINDFITGPTVDLEEKMQWVQDLQKRIEFQKPSVLVCLLDSGVNNKHPVLETILPDNRMFTYLEDWGKGDSCANGGHGTGMAGLSLFGDMADAFNSPGQLSLYHGVESFKMFHPEVDHHPELYGSITEFACSTPIANDPESRRVFCLSITNESLAFKGRPSTWSASVDRIAFGDWLDPKYPQLIILSGGNVSYLAGNDTAVMYPNRNTVSSVHDPSQSYNALTVGSYTRMDRIDAAVFPGITPLAANGHMAPSNSTSINWEKQWPVKPDIVMEGGNLGVQGGVIVDGVHTLMPLSLDKDPNMLLYPFGDTSASAALASKLAAELMTAYPDFWPETIRGLMVHSADWTDAMLENIDFSVASVIEKRNLLRTFGYGVPSIERAFYSAKNSVTLIAENEIQPYKIKNGNVVYNQYHLYKLPWPVDVLLNQVAERDAKITVTLSYFIDPNPGNKRYANNFQYHSHALDFKMIKRAEQLKEFERRISASADNEGIEFQGSDEPWALKESVRNRGSIKKDFLNTSGADLATRHVIAIYPKSGWYKTRKKFRHKAESNVRYSLIISIETEPTDIDIYTPVHQLIENVTPVAITIPSE